MTVGIEGEAGDSVYVLTSMEGIDYLFSFAIPKQIALGELNRKAIEFCSREIGQETEVCRSFVGNNFADVVKSICLSQ